MVRSRPSRAASAGASTALSATASRSGPRTTARLSSRLRRDERLDPALHPFRRHPCRPDGGGGDRAGDGGAGARGVLTGGIHEEDRTVLGLEEDAHPVRGRLRYRDRGRQPAHPQRGGGRILEDHVQVRRVVDEDDGPGPCHPHPVEAGAGGGDHVLERRGNTRAGDVLQHRADRVDRLPGAQAPGHGLVREAVDRPLPAGVDVCDPLQLHLHRVVERPERHTREIGLEGHRRLERGQRRGDRLDEHGGRSLREALPVPQDVVRVVAVDDPLCGSLSERGEGVVPGPPQRGGGETEELRLRQHLVDLVRGHRLEQRVCVPQQCDEVVLGDGGAGAVPCAHRGLGTVPGCRRSLVRVASLAPPRAQQGHEHEPAQLQDLRARGVEARERGPAPLVAAQQVDALARRRRPGQHVRDVHGVREPRRQEVRPHLRAGCARRLVELRRRLPLRVRRVARRGQPAQRRRQLRHEGELPGIRTRRPRQGLRIATAHAAAHQLGHVPVGELRDRCERQGRRRGRPGSLRVLPQGCGDGGDVQGPGVAGGLPRLRGRAGGGRHRQERARLRLHAEARGARGVAAVGRPQQAGADSGIQGGLGSGGEGRGQQLVPFDDGGDPGEDGGPVDDAQGRGVQ